MTNIMKIPVVWTGLTGLPGVSVFYGTNAGSLVSDLATFFNAIKALFPSGLSWQVPGTGDLIDDVSGHLVGGWTALGATTVTSTGSGIWAAGTGCMVRWDTGTIVNHRRLRGRTFLAPLFGSAFQTDGTIVNAYVTTMQTAADAVVAAGALRIWHRPPKGTFTGGVSAVATGALLEDRVTSLRSRRT